MSISFLAQLFQKDHQTADWPDGEIISGTIEPYWEQGMEGQIDFVFVPEHGREEINVGRGYFLTSGGYLRIFQQNGSVLWQGQLKFIPSRINNLLFRDRHTLKSGVWSTLKQEGVSYADWIGWFWASPRLRAEFQRRPD
ncbi:MAG: hypothetical protein AAGD96_30025 [Chloroflexota bacterium]